MQAGYTYIWKYLVPPHTARAFEKAYGPKGAWVKLFKNHDGYLRTELHKDVGGSGQYVTIDYWESQDAYHAFREKSPKAYKKLEDKYAGLTNQQVYIGAFGLVG